MISKKDIPIFLKTSVSAQFLGKNPRYKPVFAKCVVCGKYSLKPVGLSKINKISDIKDTNERRCTLCNYVHVMNLVVSSNKVSAAAIEGRILLDKNERFTSTL